MTVTTYQPPRDTVDGWAAMLGMSRELATFIAGTEFVPGALRGKPAAVAACILAGRELGIGPMASLQHLHVIDGRPGMSAQLMRALVLAHGHHLRVVESSSVRCVLEGRRAGETEPAARVPWTMDDARLARLDQKPVWKAYPRAMLLARATGELCRAVFADVIGGMAYTSEELDDLAGSPPAPAVEPPAGVNVVQRQAQELPQAGTIAPSLAQPAAPARQPGDGMEPGELVRGVDEPLLEGDENTAEELDDLPARPRSSEATRAAAIARARAEKAGATATPRTDEAMGQQQSGDGTATADQQRHVFALLRELERADSREQRMRVAQGLLSRRVTSFQELSVSDASAIIDTLIRAKESAEPGEYLDWLVDQGMEALELLESGEATVDADVVEGPWDEPQP